MGGFIFLLISSLAYFHDRVIHYANNVSCEQSKVVIGAWIEPIALNCMLFEQGIMNVHTFSVNDFSVQEHAAPFLLLEHDQNWDILKLSPS